MSEKWNDRYRSGAWAGRAPDPLVVTFGSCLEPGDALDLACGPGRHTIWLAEHGWKVTAVDSSAVALEMLKREVHSGVTVVHADIEQGKFALPAESFDLVIDTFFLWRPLWPGIIRALRPGGTFIGVFPTEAPLGRPFNPGYVIQSGELAEAFRDLTVLHDRATQGRAEFVARRLTR